MQFPDYNSGNVILSEGNSYPFKITNLIQMQDENFYYVLQDINGMKHFMPAGNYTNYNFRIGEEIQCSIAKINCTGRIFLEPENPLYKVGEFYYFDLIDKPENESDNILIVRDFYNNLIEIPIQTDLKTRFVEEREVLCKVLSIKKGLPVLEIPG